MVKTLDTQKAKIKSQICRNIDEYYDEFSRMSEQPGFTIDVIERLMLEQQKRLRETLAESNSELTSSIETEVKKMP
jgi:lipoate-protein ligase A